MSSLNLPDYWLPRPAPELSHEDQGRCDAYLRTILAAGPANVADYPLAVPKWQFLCHVADHHPIALHGSNQRDIARFEPRQSVDLHEFGAQRAVYAASDGIWPMYFAIVDRSRVKTLINACIRVSQAGHQDSNLGPLYVFSISRPSLAQRAYVTGMVYLLPRETFQAEPAFEFRSMEVTTAQLASPAEVLPLARIEVSPDDFPFLEQMRAHDDERLSDYAAAMQAGAPWPG